MLVERKIVSPKPRQVNVAEVNAEPFALADWPIFMPKMGRKVPVYFLSHAQPLGTCR
jgi:hypothetical protein